MGMEEPAEMEAFDDITSGVIVANSESYYDNSPMATVAIRKMLCALLERLFRDYLTRGEMQERALEYIHEEQADPRELRPFSYRWVCEELRLDPDKITAALFSEKLTLASQSRIGSKRGCRHRVTRSQPSL